MLDTVHAHTHTHTHWLKDQENKDTEKWSCVRHEIQIFREMKYNLSLEKSAGGEVGVCVLLLFNWLGSPPSLLSCLSFFCVSGRELWHNSSSVTVDYDTLDPLVRRDSYQQPSSPDAGKVLLNVFIYFQPLTTAVSSLAAWNSSGVLGNSEA